MPSTTNTAIFGMLICWPKEVRKIQSLPICVISAASAPTICGISACCASSMFTFTEPENTGPRITYGLPSIAFWTWARETPALLCVSLTGALILRLRMPPLALISSMAISAPSRKLVPDTAPLPDTSITIGMNTVCCACAANASRLAAKIQIALMFPSLDSLELQDIKPRVLVCQVHEPAAIDIAVGGLQHLRPVRPRIGHLRRVGRHVERDLFRPRLVGDIVDPHAGVVVRGEDDSRALESARPVLVQVMRAEKPALRAVVGLGGLRERTDDRRIGRVAHVVGPDVAPPFLAVREGGLVPKHKQLALRQRQRRMRAAAARLRGAVHEDPRPRLVGDVDHGQPAVTPRAVGDVAVEERVVQRIALARRPCFAFSGSHARNPAASDELRLLRVLQVENGENMVGDVGEVDRGVRVAPAHVPDAVGTDAFDRHEADLARLLRPGNIVDPDAGRELDPAPLETVGRRAAEIVLVALLELLHGPHARRIDRQQEILVGLQVESARALRAGNEIGDLRLLRVAHA